MRHLRIFDSLKKDSTHVHGSSTKFLLLTLRSGRSNFTAASSSAHSPLGGTLKSASWTDHQVFIVESLTEQIYPEAAADARRERRETPRPVKPPHA